MHNNISSTCVLIGILACGLPAVSQSPRQTPLAASEALGRFELADPSNNIQLLASEPLVVDPVDIAFDEAGRLWVVEMRDYPLLPAGQKPRGRIKVLLDENHDGNFDTSRVFVDDLNMPTGLALWKDGVLVTLAGELVYFRDSDGDFVSDERQQWLVGFKEDNEQLRANHPTLGPDGWWYIACGLRGGDVRLGTHFDPQRQSKPVRIGSRDVRFHPQSQKLELITGPAQFGLCFSQTGLRVFCSNRNPAVQVLFEQQDLRPPLASLLAARRDILPAGAASKVFPLVDAWTTSNLHANQFTAACGVYLRHVESGEEIFVCEPTGSLVKRRRASLQVEGLVAQGEDHAPEWLASHDPWFRPVNLTLAPNGGLAIVDMHRAVIEHPRWVPNELKNRKDEKWGAESGRIYVVSDAAESLQETLAQLAANPLSHRSNSELVRLLEAENQWISKTANRMIRQRGTQDFHDALLTLLTDPSSSTGSKLHAITLLLGDGGPLSNEAYAWLQDLDRDTDEIVIVAALRALRARSSTMPSAVFDAAMNLLQRPESKLSDLLQFEAWLTLTPTALQKLPSLTIQKLWRNAVHTNKREVIIAAAGALKAQPVDVLSEWLSAIRDLALQNDLELSSDFIGQASEAFADAVPPTKQQQLIDLLQDHADQLEPNQLSANAAYLHSLLPLIIRLQKLGGLPEPAKWTRRLAIVARNEEASANLRIVACRGLRLLDNHLARTTLETVAQNKSLPLNVRSQAWIGYSSSLGTEKSLEILTQEILNGSQLDHSLALSVMESVPQLLNEFALRLSKSQELARAVGITGLQTLRGKVSQDAKSHLAAAIDKLVSKDRQAIVARYQASLDLKGQMAAGKQLFAQHCSTCHRIGSVGVDIGPDISDSRTKTLQQLLVAILDPNAAVDNNFFRFVVLTADEQVLEGYISDESNESITLKNANGKTSVIPRAEILQIKPTGQSLMPEGFESQLDEQAMANLLSFIKGWRYAETTIPGVTP